MLSIIIPARNESDNLKDILSYFTEGMGDINYEVLFINDFSEDNTYEKAKIIFEPHNLDNTSLIVLDGPYAAHGMRKITKDVERRGIQVTYQPFNTKDGWYSDNGKTVLEPLKL